MRVVGVVEDVHQNDFREASEPMVYHGLVGSPPDMWTIVSPAYVVRSARAAELAPEIREMIREVAPAAPMYAVHTMESLAADSMVELTFTMLTLGVASALALLLGAVGLFGVLSYVVATRKREIGLRMALGAEGARVRRMVVAQGSRVVALGILIGVVAAVATTRFLGTMLFGVQAVDASTFAVMAAVMVCVGLLATWLPARRASSVDPIEALRGE
jgi:ABC-type antimicrobial peptide transport system permease subunit